MLLLIRHAQSVNNSLPEEQRSADPGVTELGNRQAELLAGRLGEWRPTRLLTSPFRRTLETTVPVAAATGLVPELRVELHEQGGCQAGAEVSLFQGQPGMSAGEIRSEFGDWQVPDSIDGQGWWKCRVWEPPLEAEQRARRLADRLVDEFGDGGQRVAVITHGMFEPILVSALLDRRFVGSEWLGDLFNTSVTQLTIDGGLVTLNSYNDVAHLTPELLTG